MFYNHFVHIYALFCFAGDNSSKWIKKKEEKSKIDIILYIGKETEIENLALMNLKENTMIEVNSWRSWWVLRVLGRYLKRRNKGKCFGHLEENWIFEIFETKSVASMLQHWAHNVVASEMEENW